MKLHQSTLRKVDIFNTILEKLSNGDLKTKVKLNKIYGINPQGIHDMIKDSWYISSMWWSITMVVSGIVVFQISNILS